MPPMNTTNDLSVNMPNASLMYSSFTPTFGNLMFQVAPSQTGEVNFSFGQVPYLSLEALMYMQQVASQTSPTSILPGNNPGQQVTTGISTTNDASGVPRMAQGTFNNAA